MPIKRILILSLAATALSTPAWAEDTYQCGESRCYDDQADETRRLNLMQLENPGAGFDAVPGKNAGTSYDDPDDSPNADDDDSGDDMNGQGGPYDPYNPDADGDADPPDTGAYPDDDE